LEGSGPRGGPRRKVAAADAEPGSVFGCDVMHGELAQTGGTVEVGVGADRGSGRLLEKSEMNFAEGRIRQGPRGLCQAALVHLGREESCPTVQGGMYGGMEGRGDLTDAEC